MNDNTNTFVGFLFMVLLVLWAASTWGDPDLMAALIYHLSDGYYKHLERSRGASSLPGRIGEFGITIG